MSYIESLKRLNYLHSLIKSEFKGSPDEYANRLGISRPCLYTIINELQAEGACIEYNRSKRCFVYKNNFVFDFQMQVEPIPKTKHKKFKGGQLNLFRIKKIDGVVFTL